MTEPHTLRSHLAYELDRLAAEKAPIVIWNGPTLVCEGVLVAYWHPTRADPWAGGTYIVETPDGQLHRFSGVFLCGRQ